jgi:uncharacterized membrane protein YccC
LASASWWLAAASMTCVAFVVLFLGVVSSELASAAPGLLLAFILPVSLGGSASTIPDRLAGWGLATAAALLAVAWLWPAPAREPLRGPAIGACRALAARLRSDAAYMLGGPGAPTEAEHDRVVAAEQAAVAALHAVFLATPYRPTGLSTATRTVVRLVDELEWLSLVLQSGHRPKPATVQPAICRVRAVAATVLELGADVLSVTGGRSDRLHEALAELSDAVSSMEHDAAAETSAVGARREVNHPGATHGIETVITALDPTFRALELSYAVAQVARNIELTATAERRSWLDKLLGRQPRGLSGSLTAVQERAATHLRLTSVWMHNSARGAIGLGLAVLVAQLSGVQHSFWVVLGTLSVLRSNALSTGQSAARALAGTVVGSVIGAALVVPVGSDTAVLWFLLPPAILCAGVLPAAISFAAGQAAFTVTLVIVFNIVTPAGWEVGLVRIEDVALGCAVSLVVGLLFWPRGATAALGRTLADAYRAGSHYLARTVEYGLVRCSADPSTAMAARPPVDEAARAAAAARRLDDAYRSYLAERGTKPASLAEMTRLVNGVVSLRLAADAVLDLWRRDDDPTGTARASARTELLSSTRRLVDWYDALAAGLTGARPLPQALARDQLATNRLVDALRQDLVRTDGRTRGTAARMIWTGDYLDALRQTSGPLTDIPHVLTVSAAAS